MISYIKYFFRTNKQNTIFNKEYRAAYNKLWINNIRDYYP